MHKDVDKEFERFISLCNKTVFELPIEEAVKHAEQIGLLLRANSIGIYSLNEIESYLVNAVYPLIPSEFKQETTEISGGKQCLFIATELYLNGGHSRLMERLASFLDNKSMLLLTRVPLDNVLSREKEFFSEVYYDVGESTSSIDKIISILGRVLKYNVVILNIHPEDIYAVVACGIAKRINDKMKIYFINHADHLFSYGSEISDVWYEISAYGRFVDIKRKITAKKCFLGIPIKNADEIESFGCRFNDGDLIISAGSNVKYKPRGSVSIIKLVHLLLDTYKKSKMQVIGVQPFRDYWWWLSKLKYGKRLKLSKLLSYPEYLKATQTAKLYVDSHPMPGGTAFTEQYLQGRLCAGLDSMFKGYTPAEMLKVGKESQLIDYIENIDNVDFDSIRSMICHVHGFTNVKNRFISSIYNNTFATFQFWDGCGDIEEIKINKIQHIPPGFKFYKIENLCFLFKRTRALAFIIYILKRCVSSVR